MHFTSDNGLSHSSQAADNSVLNIVADLNVGRPLMAPIEYCRG